MTLDVVVHPVTEPIAWDTSVLVDTVGQYMGGNGASCSYTIAKLGVSVTLVSLAGRDAIGDQLIAKLNGATVDCRIERGDEPTSVVVSLVNPEGKRALLYHLGASAANFPERLDFPPDASHFHLGAMYRMPDIRRRGAEWIWQAQERALTTSIDMQWDHLGEWPSPPPCDLLFVNEAEALELAAAIDRQRARNIVVVKMGARGCKVLTPDEEFQIAGIPVDAVDSTGAGDCFCGAYLAALHRGKSHREAADFANEIAALSVTNPGATTALDSLK